MVFNHPPLTRIPPEISAVADYEEPARLRLDANAWAYLDGAAGDEITHRENRAAFARRRLVTRLLGDFSGPSGTQLRLLGRDLAHPILLAPVAYQKLAHEEGERATALGAAAAQAPLVVSTHASVTVEEIAAAGGGPLWFQLYMKPDRGLTLSLIRRAEAAGCTALVVTADAPVNGVRNREQRAAFRLPPGIDAAHLRGTPPRAVQGLDPAALCGGLPRHEPTWRDLAWLVAQTTLPVLLKGIMSPLDVAPALESGVAGLIVSNHGGRTLDTMPAAIDALSPIAAAVEGRVPVLMDGGIRRGTDILKARALGAQAVMIGRPYLHGLAVAGAVGVAHVVNILRAELEVAMVLTGCRTLDEITPAVLWAE